MKKKRPKIRISKYLILNLLIISFVSFTSCGKRERPVQKAIKEHLTLYPESTLQDIYKSFFQDEYGPGHLLIDTSAARNYLLHELDEMTSKGNYLAEPCGIGTNFYRVPLDLIKDTIISEDIFVSAFLEGGKNFKIPDIEEWKKKWKVILSELEPMDHALPDFHSDKQAISEMLDRGEFVVHHSQAYLQNYDPHYRIMSKRQMEEVMSLVK